MVNVLDPEHVWPPLDGVGLLQIRDLVWTPLSQVLEHELKDQLDQPPLTNQKQVEN